MRNRGVWIGFLVMCFVLTGMVGLFASYSVAVPLERALHRLAVLDGGPALGQAEARDARAAIMAEAQAEERVVATRTRWMIGLVTVISAAIGAGLLLLASQPP